MSETAARAEADACMQDWRTIDDLSEPDAALCVFAEKATATPGEMGLADVETLRGHGFCDTAIHDATQVIAYFNYINRIADCLGVDLEPEMKAQ
jgi:uncharacterized peroxidase-related enzyme